MSGEGLPKSLETIINQPDKQISLGPINVAHNPLYPPDIGPLKLIPVNNTLYEYGAISAIVNGTEQITHIVFDTNDLISQRDGSSRRFIIAANIINKTVEWFSDLPEFPSRSDQPQSIGYIRTSAAIGRGDRAIDHGEIGFLLTKIADTIKPFGLQNDQRILEALEAR